MSKERDILVRKIQKTKWFKIEGYENRLEIFSLQGLKECLRLAKKYDLSINHPCLGCGVVMIARHRHYCLKCYIKYKKEKQKEKLEKNLDTCLTKDRKEYKKYEDLSKKIFKTKEEQARRQKIKYIWKTNFERDFPNYYQYLGFLRSMKIDPLDKLAIEMKIIEMNDILKIKEALNRGYTKSFK